MAVTVLEDLSRQHATEVGDWSRLSRTPTRSATGKLGSVYQHESTKGAPVLNECCSLSLRNVVLTIENVLASLLAEEREKERQSPRAIESEPTASLPQWVHDGTASLAQWVHDGMDVESQQ